MPPPSAPGRPFAIGYLPEGSDLPLPAVILEELRNYLLGTEAIARELTRAGYSGVILSACDGPRDMVQRINVGEFDLVFATAVVFARAELAKGDHDTLAYEPILQTLLPEDLDPPRGQGPMRRGVLIVGPSSPLFAQKNPSPEEVRKLLAAGPLAVSDAYSAAGYIYPLVKIQGMYDGVRPQRIWFCGSEAEVLKHIVAGLAPMGACREGVLAELLPKGKETEYCRVLWQTDPFPTDPVLLRRELLPALSDLGRELKVGLQSFFKHTANSAPRLRLKDAAVREFEPLQRALIAAEGLTPELPPLRLNPAAAGATHASSSTQSTTVPTPESSAFSPAAPSEMNPPAKSDAATTAPVFKPALPPGIFDDGSGAP